MNSKLYNFINQKEKELKILLLVIMIFELLLILQKINSYYLILITLLFAILEKKVLRKIEAYTNINNYLKII